MDELITRFHKVAYFVGALAHGAEENLGRGSIAICALAGKEFGREAVEGVEQTDDPVKAVERLHKALTEHGIVWDFEPFLGERTTLIEQDGSKRKMRIACKTCMMRNALFRYAHEQKLSLCHMVHGVFAGALERVMPSAKNASMEILHAGQNACLEELVWEQA